MITIKTCFECETAHRLYDVKTYSTECRENIHGHSYRYVLEVARKDGGLNAAGMVCDFKALKEAVRQFEKIYDHSVILKRDDPLCEALLKECRKVNIVDDNPTAEWMACTFPEILNKIFDENTLGIEIVSLEIAETTGNIAVWRKSKGKWVMK